MSSTLKRFREKFGQLESKGLIIRGFYHVYSSNLASELEFSTSELIEDITDVQKHGDYHLALSCPFLFDRRTIPINFENIKIQIDIYGDLPDEFNIEVADEFIPIDIYWHPNRFIQYVGRCFYEIRESLNLPDITKEEILDALSFNGCFENHILEMENLKTQRIIN